MQRLRFFFHNSRIDPLDAEFLPMETFLEEDNEPLDCDSVKRAGVRYRPSLLMNLFNAGMRQSLIKHKDGGSFRNKSMSQGHINPAFSPDKIRRRGSVTSINSRASSLVGRRIISPSHSRASSISHRPSSVSQHGSFTRHRSKIYEIQQSEDKGALPNGVFSADTESIITAAELQQQSESPPSTECYEAIEVADPVPQLQPSSSSQDTAQKVEPVPFMPSIPEEPSRPVSLASLDTCIDRTKQQQQQQHKHEHQVPDNVQELVHEASKVLEELNRVVNQQGHRKDCELKGYESCCSLSDGDDDTSDEDSDVTTDRNEGGASGIATDQDTASAFDDEVTAVVIEPTKKTENVEHDATESQVHL